MAASAAEKSRTIPPGAGRRGGRPTPKGRQVEAQALLEVAQILGDRPRRADLLIEHLHLLQDAHHCLHARHLVALAHAMKLAYAEVFEVASFYAHFDVVMEGETAPPPLTVRVCDSLTCALQGADALLAQLPAALGPGVRVVRAPCLGACHQAPACALGHTLRPRATVAGVRDAIAAGAQDHPPLPQYIDLAAYRAAGGYTLLADALAGRRDVENVLTALEAANIRGLGGAGFPTGRKWRAVRAEPAPRLMAVNADEGEPGTFKDRHYLATDPHRFLEGMLLGAWAVEAADVYIYLRDEYPDCAAILHRELAALAAAGLMPHTRVHMRRGAGAYICGEESAMLESLEGKRGLPRHKPPYPSQVGLFGRPTLINNVETLWWVRDIVERGPAWWTGHEANGRKGLRTYSVSGRVARPGIVLAPAGTTASQLIDGHCGGMAAGHTFKAYLPGGASGGILPASMADVPLDFGSLEEHGCFIGSAAVVVLSDQDDMRLVGLNLLRFFEDESCGQCTPCRIGTEKAVTLLAAERWDRPLLDDVMKVMADASICGLGQVAMNPIKQIIRHFPNEVGLGQAEAAVSGQAGIPEEKPGHRPAGGDHLPEAGPAPLGGAPEPASQPVGSGTG